MAYVFPNENLFVAAVGLMILVLLVVRVVLRKRQLAQERSVRPSSVAVKRADHEPMV